MRLMRPLSLPSSSHTHTHTHTHTAHTHTHPTPRSRACQAAADASFSKKQTQLDRRLNSLSAEINVKEELLTQLRKTQLEYNSMRQDYEVKLQSLQHSLSKKEVRRRRFVSGRGGFLYRFISTACAVDTFQLRL